MNTIRFIPALVLAALAHPVWADQAVPPHAGAAPGAMTTIPQAAFDACAGKAAGAEVTWKGMHGNTLQGTCRSFGGNSLVAFPKSPSGMRPGGAAPGGMGRGAGAPGASADAPRQWPGGVSGTMNPGARVQAPSAAPGMGDSMLNKPLVPPK